MRARDAVAAERFLRKTLNPSHTQSPRVINVDKNAAAPAAVSDLSEEQRPKTRELRQVRYLNNRVELSAPIHQTIDQTGNGIWLL